MDGTVAREGILQGARLGLRNCFVGNNYRSLIAVLKLQCGISFHLVSEFNRICLGGVGV